MGRGSTQEPQLLFIYLFLHGCHNLYFSASEPSSVFRRNHVADSIDFLIILVFYQNHFADVFGLFRQNLVADTFLMTILAMETIQENFYYS